MMVSIHVHVCITVTDVMCLQELNTHMVTLGTTM